MIRFEQKQFNPLAIASMVATPVIGAFQQNAANKEQAENNERMAEEQRRHNKAMEKAQEKAAERAQKQAENTQKQFAVNPAISKATQGAGKFLQGMGGNVGGKTGLALGAMNTLGTATGVIGLAQGFQANSAQKQSNKENLEETKRHNQAIEKAAKSNPNQAIHANEVSQKAFTRAVKKAIVHARRGARAIGKTQLGGLAHDLAKTQSGNVKSAAKTAATFALMGYAGNRIATSVKDAKENENKGNKKFLKKAALTAGTIGAGVLAAKKGVLGKGAQKFMTTGKGGAALTRAGKAINPIVRDDTGKISAAGTALSGGLNAVFLSGPALAYLSQKKQEKDIAKNTKDEQKQYSAALNLAKSIGRSAKGTAKNVKAHPGQSVSSGMSHVAQFMGFYGKGGTDAIQNTGKHLRRLGRARDRKYGGTSLSTKVGNWITKTDSKGNLVNAGKANLLAAGGTLAVGSTIASKVGSAVNKPLKKLDKDAYKMEDRGNDKI